MFVADQVKSAVTSATVQENYDVMIVQDLGEIEMKHVEAVMATAMKHANIATEAIIVAPYAAVQEKHSAFL